MTRASGRDPMVGQRADLVTKAATSKAITYQAVQTLPINTPMLDTMSPEVVQNIKLVGPTMINVLITGGSDIERLQIARTIHDVSVRRLSGFVVLDCANVLAETPRAEQVSAIEGSRRDRRVRTSAHFRLAHKGTLLLKDVDRMPMPLQRDLLQVLRNQQIVVRDAKPRRIDVRLISTCHGSLSGMVEQQEFDAEFYNLLNIYPIEIRPLS